MYKIIGGDGQEYGPVSAQQLRQWMAEGRVNAQTRVRAEASADWATIADFPELATTVPPPSGAGTPPVAPGIVPSGKTSGLAISSLVLGILGFFCWIFTALPGLILGIVSLKKIGQSGGKLTGRGIAISGIAVSSAMLVLGLGLVGMYAAMLLPALNAARGKAREANCVSNLRQVGLSLAIFADTNGDRLPDANWCDALTNVTSSTKIFICPSAQAEEYSYGFNVHMLGKKWQADPDAVLLFEIDGGKNVVGDAAQLLAKPRHPDGYVFLFNDGHVEVVRPDRVSSLRWIPRENQ